MNQPNMLIYTFLLRRFFEAILRYSVQLNTIYLTINSYPMQAVFSKLMNVHLYAFSIGFYILFFLPVYWVLGFPHPKTLLVLGLTLCLSSVINYTIARFDDDE
jgi:MFS superfamily sulfate permease-like transporter